MFDYLVITLRSISSVLARLSAEAALTDIPTPIPGVNAYG